MVNHQYILNLHLFLQISDDGLNTTFALLKWWKENLNDLRTMFELLMFDLQSNDGQDYGKYKGQNYLHLVLHKTSLNFLA